MLPIISRYKIKLGAWGVKRRATGVESVRTKKIQDTLLTIIDNFGNDEVAVAKNLWTFAEDGEEYNAFVNHPQELNDEIELENGSEKSFQTEVSGSSAEYTSDEAEKKLEGIFDNVSNHWNYLSNCSDYWEPVHNLIWILYCLIKPKKYMKIIKSKFKNTVEIFLHWRKEDNCYTFHVPILLQHPEKQYQLVNEKLFQGALLDTGAQKSVTGYNHALAYCK